MLNSLYFTLNRCQGTGFGNFVVHEVVLRASFLSETRSFYPAPSSNSLHFTRHVIDRYAVCKLDFSNWWIIELIKLGNFIKCQIGGA
ncbi:unnamed protein product [Malus baccata var. baccata]